MCVYVYVYNYSYIYIYIYFHNYIYNYNLHLRFAVCLAQGPASRGGKGGREWVFPFKGKGAVSAEGRALKRRKSGRIWCAC